MKTTKLLFATLIAAGTLSLATAPVFAGHHEGGEKGAKMFEKHDTNGDGVITLEEHLEHAKERFNKMDADGDGKISKEEARAAKEKMKEMMQEKRAEKRAEKAEENSAVE